MSYNKSTIREVRAVVFSTTATGGDAVEAWENAQGLHAHGLESLRTTRLGIEHIGPAFGGSATCAAEPHPFRDVLIGIALGAEIEWNPYAHLPNEPAKWQKDDPYSVLRDIGSGAAHAGEYRVKP